MTGSWFSWRTAPGAYAWGARDLKVIYQELGRSTRLAADLKQSQLETREKAFFLNAISHDLRTPLNGLMLQASVAEMALDGNDHDVLRQSVQEIKASASAAGRMLDSLLTYAQLAATESGGGVSSFALRGLVESIQRRLGPQASQKGLFLRINVDDNLYLQTSHGKLERILSNLVENGIKYTEAGGVRVEAQTDGKSIELHVCDTGVGIAPEHRERLFDEFYQIGNAARDQSNGYGLGLAIARRLATQLGAEIVVESDVGKGSRFSLLLPECVAPAPDAGTVVGPAVSLGA